MYTYSTWWKTNNYEKMRQAIWFIQFIGDLSDILGKFCIHKIDYFADFFKDLLHKNVSEDKFVIISRHIEPEVIIRS